MSGKLTSVVSFYLSLNGFYLIMASQKLSVSIKQIVNEVELTLHTSHKGHGLNSSSGPSKIQSLKGI